MRQRTGAMTATSGTHLSRTFLFVNIPRAADHQPEETLTILPCDGMHTHFDKLISADSLNGGRADYGINDLRVMECGRC